MKRMNRMAGVAAAAALCAAGVVAEEAARPLAEATGVRAESTTDASPREAPAVQPVVSTVEEAAAPVAEAPVQQPKPSTRFAGLEGVKDQQTVITSSRIEFDYKEMVAVFDENVRVENPQFLMLADRVLVFLDGTNDVKQILALGRVSVTNEMRSAACDKAVYTRAADQLVLTGNAELRRGGDYVKGDRIAIWLNDERMEVSPGMFVIAPETIKERQAADGDKREPR